MSSADKRTPHTDALETLGFIHENEEHRDAIHLAVEQVVAGESLKPGDHIGFGDDGRVYKNNRKTNKKLGIVDPFICRNLFAGERFWLVVYPREITSLRHVWTHPDFPEAEVKPSLEDIALDELLGEIGKRASTPKK